MPNPRFGRQTRVIWQRRAPPLSQPGCGVLDRAPRQAVNNAGVFRMLVIEKAQQIVARILLRNYTIEQIGAVIACGEQPGRAEMQPLGDIATGRFVRGRRQSQHGRVGEALFEDAE